MRDDIETTDYDALDAVAELAGRTPDEEAAGVLLDLIDDHGVPELQAAALASVPAGDVPTSSLLAIALGTGPPALRMEAVERLGDRVADDPGTRSLLQKLAADDGAPFLQHPASDALARLRPR